MDRPNAKVDFERRGGMNQPDNFGHYKTNAADLYFTYPVKLMLPTHASASNCQWVYAINYGGGIVSGDNIKIQARIKDQCCAMITTQASTKVYHSEDEQESVQILEGIAESGSTLAVLQDPVTCFANARYKQTQSFDVSEDSNLILMDWLTAGRIARGECWNFTSYSSCNCVTYSGTLIYRDSITLKKTPQSSIRQRMGQHTAIASCVLVGDKLRYISKQVLAKFGGMQDYGVKPDQNITVAVSPIERTINHKEIPGVIIKFASSSVSQVSVIMSYHKVC
ncbi:urease accessory protein D-like isoform X2 [Lytechinus variegatus]|uniref:urease accessory protein D-like isoform X2 n=1 Tax=Lytechinus variegatus TaxID=7654 RepID=UPI001BB24200|nr:urease accessory protein D-like isoform X2 [Lytechinus variegatus]